MKRLVVFLTSISLCISALAQNTFEVDGINYSIIKEADESSTFGTVCVTAREGKDYIGDIIIPNGVKNGDGEFADQYKVIGIDDLAFQNNTKLKSVTLGISIESIAPYAFMGCDSLETVVIPRGNLRTIGELAFACSGIHQINIPASVTSIGPVAFAQCGKLETVSLPSSLKTIALGAFSGCTSIKEIIIPDGVTRILDGTFEGCTSLEHLVLPSKLTSIASQAFSACVSLIEVKFPESLRSIGDAAFSGCVQLKKTQLPKGVSIGTYAFSRCPEWE